MDPPADLGEVYAALQQHSIQNVPSAFSHQISAPAGHTGLGAFGDEPAASEMPDDVVDALLAAPDISCEDDMLLADTCHSGVSHSEASWLLDRQVCSLAMCEAVPHIVLHTLLSCLSLA